MNGTVEKFISEKGLDVGKIRGLSEAVLRSMKEINPLIEQYQISGETYDEVISIADIYGHSQRYGNEADKDIFALLNHLFDASGDGYHRRSISMLDYSTDEIVSGLQNSFSKEPMSVSMVEDGEYVITYNGMHRFAVLKAAYLNELSQATTFEEKEQLNKKYKIPVKITNIDYVKTYCNCLLSACLDDNNFCLSSEYDSKYCLTGKTRLEISGEKYILTDEELLNYTRICLNSKLNLGTINRATLKYPSFNNFIDTYFSDLKDNIPSRS